MHTIPRTPASEHISGGIQSPLLSADQLVPGVYLAGNTMQNIWRVMATDRENDTVVLQNELTPADRREHGEGRRGPIQHRFTLYGNTTCECGQRRQRILGQAEDRSDGILPMRDNMPRVYVIAPMAPLSQPDRFTVYLTPEGSIVTASIGIWSNALPLIPRLYPAWSLPEALRGRLP